MRLENKKVIITGAASGFGAGIAKKFIEEGANVIVADINEKTAHKTVLDLGARAHAFFVDVSKSASVIQAERFFIITFWHS
jgi:3-oxoacyl-[acyl-carrier protein] reductase